MVWKIVWVDQPQAELEQLKNLDLIAFRHIELALLPSFTI